MDNKQYQAACGLILAAAEAAALKAAGPEDCPVDVGPVTYAPQVGRGSFPTLTIAWSVGPAWGRLRIEFRPLRSYAPAVGLWRRADGVAMTPAGFPMLPALSLALRHIADAACATADRTMPGGVPMDENA